MGDFTYEPGTTRSTLQISKLKYTHVNNPVYPLPTVAFGWLYLMQTVKKYLRKF